MKIKILRVSIFLSVLLGMICVLSSVVTAPVSAESVDWSNLVGNPTYKWYDGSSTWSSTQTSPMATVDSSLEEGVDYKRLYWFTDTLDNPTSDTKWVDSAEGMNQPGFIWEKVQGIGKYSAYSKNVRHNILTLIDVTVSNQSKLEGDTDPNPIVGISYYNNSPNQTITSEDFVITREDGEVAGTYSYHIDFQYDTVKARLELTPRSLLSANNMYYTVGHKSKGFIYLRYNAGALTIKPSVDVSGTKTWEDNDNKDGSRPNSITVNLFANGELTDSKTVTADDNWQYSFTGLPKNDDNDEAIEYTVTEDAVEGYTVTYNGYDITNTYTVAATDDNSDSEDNTSSGTEEDSDDTTSPKTGDESNVTLWSTLLLASTLGVILCVFNRKRRHSAK